MATMSFKDVDFDLNFALVAKKQIGFLDVEEMAEFIRTAFMSPRGET